MNIVTVYGSPTPPGKLARGLDLLERAFHEASPESSVQRISPAPTEQFVVGSWAPSAVETIAAADVVVFASPVFRASMTGTLKLLIDMIPVEALRSTPVGIMTVGAAPQHCFSAERHLRDTLSWFGALIAPNSLFFVDTVFAEQHVDSQTSSDLSEFTQQMIELSRRTAGLELGPEPLTLRFQKLTGSRPAHS